MALSSYCDLARYEEDTSRNYRARNLDDIRAQIRANIVESRFRTRSYKMFQNRRSLVEAISTTLVYLNKDPNSCDCSTADSDNAKSWQDEFEENDNCNTQIGSNSPRSSDQEDYYQSIPSTPDTQPTISQEQWVDTTFESSHEEADDYTLTNNELQFYCHDATPTNRSVRQTSSPWSSSINSSPAIQQWDSPPRSNSPSPVSSSLCVDIDGCPVPTYFLEPNHPSSQHPKRPKSLSINLHQQAYKQSSLSPKVSSQATLDIGKIKTDFEQFQKRVEIYISNNASIDFISDLIKQNWPIITNSFQTMDTRVISDSIELLCNLIVANLIDSNCICHMLQNGLIFCLKSCINQLSDGLFQIIKLIINIARSNTAILPYMIDLIYHSKLFNEFEVALRVGSNNDIKMVVEFYYLISETLIAQIISSNEQEQQCPVLPDILLRTGTNSETKHTYSYSSTLAKCYSTNLIKTLSRVSLNRANQREEEMITMTLIILANALKLAHIKSIVLASPTVNSDLSLHNQKVEQLWIVKSLCAVRDSEIESKLDSLIRAFTRLQQMSETSDQCSQGVGTDNLAARSKQQCQQFIDFYQKYYGALSASFTEALQQCCCSLTL